MVDPERIKTVTIKPHVYKRLTAVRFDLSTQNRIITYSEVVESLIQMYEDKMNRKGEENV